MLIRRRNDHISEAYELDGAKYEQNGPINWHELAHTQNQEACSRRPDYDLEKKLVVKTEAFKSATGSRTHPVS
jgi:hypothetical protein